MENIPEELEPLISQATDAALIWARLDAGFGILGGIIMLIIAYYLGKWAFGEFKKAAESPGGGDTDDENLVLVAGAASAVIGLIGAFHVLNPWRWVGVFEPAVWIVHQAAGAL
jgi:hypothetical protein